jgi:hypothetical protein
MYSQSTQQMNTTRYLNKQVRKIIVLMEPIATVKHPRILCRQEGHKPSKDIKFKNAGLGAISRIKALQTFQTKVTVFQSVRY